MFTLSIGVLIRSGLEARNKCPCVIDYTLQANEINRAWIDWVGKESRQRGICSRVQRLYWHAHIQRPSERNQAGLLAENRAVSFSAAWSCFAHYCNQGQCCSNQILAMGSDKLGTYRLTITAKKTFSSQRQTRQGLCSRQSCINRQVAESTLNCSQCQSKLQYRLNLKSLAHWLMRDSLIFQVQWFTN